MIEIPDPPTVLACAACAKPISWLWSPRTQRWVAFVSTDDCASYRCIAPHMCAPPLQDIATWRTLPHGSPPTPEYVQAKKNLATKETT